MHWAFGCFILMERLRCLCLGELTQCVLMGQTSRLDAARAFQQGIRRASF